MTRRQKKGGFTRNLNKKYEQLKQHYGISPDYAKYTRDFDWKNKPLGAAYWAYRRITRRKKPKVDAAKLVEQTLKKKKADAQNNETARLAAETETARQLKEAEAARMRAEAETARVQATDAALRIEMAASEKIREAEAARMRAEAETARLRAETARLKTEAEAARLKTDAHLRDEARLNPEALLRTDARKPESEASPEAPKLGPFGFGSPNKTPKSSPSPRSGPFGFGPPKIPVKLNHGEKPNTPLTESAAVVNMIWDSESKTKNVKIELGSIITFHLKSDPDIKSGTVVNGDDTILYVCIWTADPFGPKNPKEPYTVFEINADEIQLHSIDQKNKGRTKRVCYHNYKDPPERMTAAVFAVDDTTPIERDELLKSSTDIGMYLNGIIIENEKDYAHVWVQHMIDSKSGNVYKYPLQKTRGLYGIGRSKSYVCDEKEAVEANVKEVVELVEESKLLPVKVADNMYTLPKSSAPLVANYVFPDQTMIQNGTYEVLVDPKGEVFFGNKLSLDSDDFYVKHPYLTAGFVTAFVTGAVLLYLKKSNPELSIDAPSDDYTEDRAAHLKENELENALAAVPNPDSPGPILPGPIAPLAHEGNQVAVHVDHQANLEAADRKTDIAARKEGRDVAKAKGLEARAERKAALDLKKAVPVEPLAHTGNQVAVHVDHQQKLEAADLQAEKKAFQQQRADVRAERIADFQAQKKTAPDVLKSPPASPPALPVPPALPLPPPVPPPLPVPPPAPAPQGPPIPQAPFQAQQAPPNPTAPDENIEVGWGEWISNLGYTRKQNLQRARVRYIQEIKQIESGLARDPKNRWLPRDLEQARLNLANTEKGLAKVGGKKKSKTRRKTRRKF